MGMESNRNQLTTHIAKPHKPTLKPKLGGSVCLSNRTTKPTDNPMEEKEQRRHNITYTQAGVSCFVGQVRGIFKVQFFVGSSVVKIPACV